MDSVKAALRSTSLSLSSINQTGATYNPKAEGWINLVDIDHPEAQPTNKMSQMAFRHLGFLRAWIECAKIKKSFSIKSCEIELKLNRKSLSDAAINPYINGKVIIQRGQIRFPAQIQITSTLDLVQQEYAKDPQHCLVILFTLLKAGQAATILQSDKDLAARFDLLRSQCVGLIANDLFVVFATSLARVSQEEIERHLTHIGKADYSDMCPNLDEVSQRASRLSHRVTSTVLGCVIPEQRAAIIESYILVAKQAFLKEDYRSFSSIVQGLNHSAVTDMLPDNWDYVAPELQKDFQNFCGILAVHRKSEEYCQLMMRSSPEALICPDPFLSQLVRLKASMEIAQNDLKTWKEQRAFIHHYAKLKIKELTEEHKQMFCQRGKLAKQLAKIEGMSFEQIGERMALQAEIRTLENALPKDSSQRLIKAIEKLEAELVKLSQELNEAGCDPQEAIALATRIEVLNSKLNKANEIKTRDLWEVKKEASLDSKQKKHYQYALQRSTEQYHQLMAFLVDRTSHLNEKISAKCIHFDETARLCVKKRITGLDAMNMDDRFYSLAALHKCRSAIKAN